MPQIIRKACLLWPGRHRYACDWSVAGRFLPYSADLSRDPSGKNIQYIVKISPGSQQQVHNISTRWNSFCCCIQGPCPNHKRQLQPIHLDMLWQIQTIPRPNCIECSRYGRRRLPPNLSELKSEFPAWYCSVLSVCSRCQLFSCECRLGPRAFKDYRGWLEHPSSDL